MIKMFEYLKSHNFKKRLKTLKVMLKSKKVLIYGAGKLFEAVREEYDLSGINISGITDKKFLIEDEAVNFRGMELFHTKNLNRLILIVLLLL